MAGHIKASPPERYAAISQRLLQQAQAELAKGDILQASEKAWGATAHAVKSACQRLGWNHHAHHHLNAAANYIATEYGRSDLRLAFGYQEALHINWYEHQKEADLVQDEVNQAVHFTAELAALPIGELLHNPVQANLPRIERDGQERRLRTLTRKTQHSHGPQLTPEEVAELPPVAPPPAASGD